IVRLYDLDESGALTVDEVTLALKGALSGVAKLAGEEPPLESALDATSRLVSAGALQPAAPRAVAGQALSGLSAQAFARSDRDPSTRLSRGELRRFCASSPEVRSWVAYFRDASPEAPTRASVDSSPGAAAVSLHPEDEPWLAAELDTQAPERPGASLAVRAALRPEDAAVRAYRERSRAEAHMGPAAEHLAGMAWLEQARHLVPSSPPPPSTALPDVEARLEWTNCFSGGAARSLAAYGPGGRVVFASAALATSLPPRPGPQGRSAAGRRRAGLPKAAPAGAAPSDGGSSATLFCREHTGQVVSLAVHPAGEVVATGERGPVPRVVVWRPARAAAGSGSTAEVVRVLHGLHSAAVTQCAFSPSGRMLATVGADPTRRVVVFDWAAGCHRASAADASSAAAVAAPAAAGVVALADQSTARETLGCCWRDEHTLVTVGRDHLALWDVASRRKSVGLFGAAPGVSVQTLLCVAAFGGDGPRGTGEGAMLATGTMSGHVFLWRGRCCVRAVRAHEGPVLALSGAGRGLATGSADGRVRVWSGRLECESTADVSALGPFDAAVCAVDWDP
ncbi:Eml6, partial [Symbiodinium sp. KB8]